MIFHPNLSPKEIIRMGSFGGIYFNSSNNIKIDYREFPSDWFKDVPESFYLSDQYNKNVNFFKIKSGQDQDEWENKGWIHPQDPRGWFQWYCRYYLGRRTKDDERQIKRWNNFCGKKGRWRNYIYRKIFDKNTTVDDHSFSRAVRQSLLHWGYSVNQADYDIWKIQNGY